MPPARNVLFITVDQWRGDCLSALGHPVSRRRRSTRWPPAASSSPTTGRTRHRAARRGPASTPGTYQHRNRSILNGTPLDARFTNVALMARETGLRPGALRLHRHLGRPAHGAARRSPPVQLRGRPAGIPRRDRGPVGAGEPGLGALAGRPGLRRARRTPTICTSRSRASRVPTRTARPGRPPRFPAELSQTTFVRRRGHASGSSSNGDEPFFVHTSFIRPHPPRRNPIGYHDLYPAEAVGPLRGCATPEEEEAAIHPLAAPRRRRSPGVGAPRRRAGAAPGPRHVLRRPARGRRRPGTALRVPRRRAGLAESTLVVLTSDHGEMGGDHWLLEKLGYWDESYHVPLIVVDPRPAGGRRAGDDRRRGHRVGRRPADHLRLPGRRCRCQADGWSLARSSAATPPRSTGATKFRHSVGERSVGCPADLDSWTLRTALQLLEKDEPGWPRHDELMGGARPD